MAQTNEDRGKYATKQPANITTLEELRASLDALHAPDHLVLFAIRYKQLLDAGELVTRDLLQERLGKSKAQINKSLKALRDLGIIQKIAAHGTSRVAHPTSRSAHPTSRGSSGEPVTPIKDIKEREISSDPSHSHSYLTGPFKILLQRWSLKVQDTNPKLAHKAAELFSPEQLEQLTPAADRFLDYWAATYAKDTAIPSLAKALENGHLSNCQRWAEKNPAKTWTPTPDGYEW